jgi:CHAT domain-containing protein
MLYLGDLPPIERHMEAWRQAVRTNDARALDAAADRLRRLLWQPIRPHLGESRVVLIAPDGPLARFPFAALPGQQPGSFLMEELTIGYVSSARQLADLAHRDDPPTAPAGLLGLGGLDFDNIPGGNNPFPPLPGTGLEAERALALFAGRFPDQPKALLRGAEPTPDKIRTELKRRYAYLHLATHGFFESPDRLARLLHAARQADRDLSPTQRQAQADVLDLLPLLKSGLALAGANRAGNAALLTAEDLAGLDLRGCELVVLSACETGLGELHRNEGVLGLQRNFHAAGARSVAASLWQVSDAATSVLMEQFYTHLWDRDKPMGKLEALRQAQLFVLRHPDKVRARAQELKAEAARRGILGDVATELPDGGKVEPALPRSPVAWWAAFVLSGDGGVVKR